jgi:hypothetical protein
MGQAFKSDVQIVEVRTDDYVRGIAKREYWAAAAAPEQAVMLVLAAIPEGWACSLSELPAEKSQVTSLYSPARPVWFDQDHEVARSPQPGKLQREASLWTTRHLGVKEISGSSGSLRVDGPNRPFPHPYNERNARFIAFWCVENLIFCTHENARCRLSRPSGSAC